MMKFDSLGAGTGRRLRTALATSLGLLLGTAAQAQQAGFFRDNAGARSASPLATALPAARALSLDVAGMRTALAAAPLETQAGATPLVLTLPLPDGSSARFRVLEAPVMEPGLAAQFPDIRTYAGVGLDDPRATVRLDLTPRGFHAQVLSPTTGTFFIDPTVLNATSTPSSYLSFWRRDMPGASFSCEVVPAGKATAGTGQRTSGPTLRTYRLAVAATGEYTTYYGGTVAAAQAAIVTTVNRVVGVYEKELAVRMVLVANNSSLIYTNASTDPYANTSADLAANQANVDAIIGTANYDIGHLVGTGGGGIAGLGVVCRAGQKARGLTGSPAPIGDAFDIDYVAHEMGHQFGCNHTFNSSGTGTGSCNGNRNASTAYEPGSGTTIMAYAGICGAPSNTANNSDAFFHVVSYEEAQAYMATTSCAVSTATGNNPPTVRTLPASGKVLPISTPFKLTANGYDLDNDQVTYNWEEYDLGSAGTPGAAQVANDNVPLFRSFYPTVSPTRYFPRLSNLVANTTNIGERLPSVSRTLTFRVTLRDHFTTANQGMGTVGAVNSSAPVTMTTTSTAGPFVVTYPDAGGLSLAGGSSQTVTWNVAGTDANGVNCASVNILLSTDGGLTYPTVLLTNTANDGTESITLPNVVTSTARIMVEAADNYFFDISNNNFTIASATPCGTVSNVTVSNVTGTTAAVSWTAGNSATSYLVTTSPATLSQTVTGTSAVLSGLVPGTTYQVLVQSICSSSSNASTATSATFTTTPPPPCNEATNLTVSNITNTSATVSFTATSAVTNYTVTTAPATTSQTITGTTVTLSGLTPGGNYTVYITSNCTGGGVATASTTLTTTAPAPANDDCAGAVVLTPAATCVPTTGTILGSTPSSLPASACSGYASTVANDVWYSFVATSTVHTVVVASGTIDAVVQLVTGTCTAPTAGQCIDANGPGGTERLSLTGLTVGTRYLVRVYGYTDSSNPYITGSFTICVTGPAPTCNAPTGAAVSNTSGTTSALTFTSNALGATYTVTTSPATSTYTTNGVSGLVNLTGLTPNTQYTVTLNGTCSNGTALAPVTITFTSAGPLASAAALELSQASIVPNPAHGSFAVQLPVVSGQRPVQATLLTVLGQPVLSRTLAPTATGATADFNVQGLAQGVYVLRLTAGDQSVVRRVVLE